MPLLEEQLNTAISEDTLLHGEALLVIATTDTNHIALCVRCGVWCVCDKCDVLLIANFANAKSDSNSYRNAIKLVQYHPLQWNHS